MNPIEILASPRPEQLQAIYEERQKINEEFGKACAKARTAAVYLRKETWGLHYLAYVNALLRGVKHANISDSYVVMVLISTIESFSFAQMGMLGLTYTDYNIAIGPVASIICPEMFQDSQTWQIQPVIVPKYPTPYYPEGYASKTGRKKTVDLDPYGELQELGLTPEALGRMISNVSSALNQSAAKPAPNADVSDAIQKMKAKMATPKVVGVVPEPMSAIERMKARMRAKNVL